MPIAHIPLESICRAADDPFGRDKIIEVSTITIELMYAQVCVSFMDSEINIHKDSGKPAEETDIDTAKQLYSLLEQAYAEVKNKTESGQTSQSAFGLNNKELRELERFLELALSEKDDYLARFKAEKDSLKSSLSSTDFGDADHFEYLGQKEGAHLYENVGDLARYDVKLIPVEEGNIFKIESSATITGANRPHFTSCRFVDLTRSSVDKELNLEFHLLHLATRHARDYFVD